LESAILLFLTTQAALQAEEALLEAGLGVEVVPKPPGHSGHCGLALELPRDHEAAAGRVLKAAAIEFERYAGQQGS